MPQPDVLIDVSRLVWRFWRGKHPTGIDRVCLAYVEHFGNRAQAVIQRSGRYFILRRSHSDRLFALFAREPAFFKRDFVRLAVRAFPAAKGSVSKRGLLYLNVGHTGLDEPTMPLWVATNGLKAIFLIHDLIPLLHPEYCRAGEAVRHHRRMENVLTSATGIIGNSQTTVDDLAQFAKSQRLGMPPSVAALIAGSEMGTAITAKTFAEPHFVIVGTIEARKNHALLLQVWKRLVEELGSGAPLLAIVGHRGWEADQAIAILDRAALAGKVIEISNCNDRDLAGLIAGARALLMPSFAEGFGLPIAEALQLGTPVLASDLPVFREFASNIPTYLDSLDGPAWQSAVMEFTGKTRERERQLIAIKSYRAPDWDSHFQVVEEWLDMLH